MSLANSSCSRPSTPVPLVMLQHKDADGSVQEEEEKIVEEEESFVVDLKKGKRL